MFLGRCSADCRSEGQTAGVPRTRLGRSALIAALAVLWTCLPSPAAAVDCEVRGAIGDYWRSVGADVSFLGPCLTGELPVTGGMVQHFRGGSVYWSAATGARSVHGAIRSAYNAAGGPSSRLGLPTTHETPTPSRPGAFNHFQGGSLYWSPTTGARRVLGAIRDRWAGFGWENSALGFPVSDEYSVPDGSRSDFSGGVTSFDGRTGSTAVSTGSRPSFTFSEQPVTAADMPSTYRTGCPVPPQDLRLLGMSYVDFADVHRTGEMVVHSDQVRSVLRIFAGLHAERFSIARMQRVDGFGGSDAASMDANNTSGFNCRSTTSGTAWSEHAYGRAVDVNPVQNPYVNGSTVLPEAGRAYLDRADRRPGMALPGESAVQAFAAQGWGWGGGWTSTRDYQHFSLSGR